MLATLSVKRLRDAGYPQSHPVFALFWGEDAAEVPVQDVLETASGAPVLVLDGGAMILRTHAVATRA